MPLSFVFRWLVSTSKLSSFLVCGAMFLGSVVMFFSNKYFGYVVGNWEFLLTSSGTKSLWFDFFNQFIGDKHARIIKWQIIQNITTLH